jgi:hypothetical protein
MTIYAINWNSLVDRSTGEQILQDKNITIIRGTPFCSDVRSVYDFDTMREMLKDHGFVTMLHNTQKETAQ